MVAVVNLTIFCYILHSLLSGIMKWSVLLNRVKTLKSARRLYKQKEKNSVECWILIILMIEKWSVTMILSRLLMTISKKH